MIWIFTQDANSAFIAHSGSFTTWAQQQWSWLCNACGQAFTDLLRQPEEKPRRVTNAGTVLYSFMNCSKNGVQGQMNITKVWCSSWGLWQCLLFCIWLPTSKIEYIPKTNSLTWKHGRRIQGASTVQLVNWQEQRTGGKLASPPVPLVPQSSHKSNMDSSPNTFSEQE